MRAALYRRRGPARDVLAIETLPDPAPAAGEVRVRLAYSGVNPSDVKSRAGTVPRPMEHAYVVPHSDGAGVVDAVGAGVAAEEWLGRRVWVYHAQWGRALGTAAECVALPVEQAVPLPDGVSFEVGVSLGIPAMTAYHAVVASGAAPGSTVLVPGAAGAVGYYATQFARLAGARVIGVVSSDDKAAIARSAGADDIVNYRSEDLVARVQALTAGRGVDALIDVDAATHAPRYGELLAFGGRAVVYGSNQPVISMPFRPMMMAFATVTFFIVYRLPPEPVRSTLDGITARLRDGSLRHAATAVYALDDIAAAHEQVERGAGAKVLIRLASA